MSRAHLCEIPEQKTEKILQASGGKRRERERQQFTSKAQAMRISASNFATTLESRKQRSNIFKMATDHDSCLCREHENSTRTFAGSEFQTQCPPNPFLRELPRTSVRTASPEWEHKGHRRWVSNQEGDKRWPWELPSSRPLPRNQL